MKILIKNLFSKKYVEKDEKKGDIEVSDHGEADFETAISAASFGKFNLLLILLTIPMCWTAIFETTTMSYVFPAAQCDLNLSLEDKGLLNAVTYGGTVSSAFIWGFLFDTLGRKHLLIGGFFINGIFVILSGFSQNLTFLMAMKFMGGFIMNGPYAAVATYFSEINSSKYRPKVPILLGLWNAVGGIYLPLLASYVLPLKFEWKVGNWVVHSWGLYLIINAIPALLSSVIFSFLPESPKFLMSKGKNEEALDVFRLIYSVNTGKPKDTYPVKKLKSEFEKPQHDTADEKKKSGFQQGWNQMAPLFRSPYLSIFILVSLLQLFMTMSLYTLRLWFPQIFQAINDYKFEYGKSSQLCEMLNVLHPSENNGECFVNTDNFEVYQNLMIVSAATVLFYLLAGGLLSFVGQKWLLTLVSLLAGFSGAGIYFSPNSEIATTLMAGFSSLGVLGTDVVLIIVVNLFPTSLRTMTVSLVMMSGRAAAMCGNIIFPYLLELGCGPPFFSAAALFFLGCILSILIPKENKNFI